MDGKDIINNKAVERKIQQIDNDFDLVMISEDFDASIVLLSNLLCWPLANMTSLKINERKKSRVMKLSRKSRKMLKEWLWADYMLYEYFKKELVRKKTLFGVDKIEKEVYKLKELNRNLSSECVLNVVENTNDLKVEYVHSSQHVLLFKVNESNVMCKYYGITETHFINYLREIQIKRHHQWRLKT